MLVYRYVASASEWSALVRFISWSEHWSHFHLFQHLQVFLISNFFLRRRVQTCSGAHPATYLMGTGSSFPAGKAAGAWSWSHNTI